MPTIPGGWEWILIFVVILIIFGPKSLPKIGNAIGKGIREFKEASEGLTRAIEEETSAAEYRDNEGSGSVDTSASSEATPDESYEDESMNGEPTYGEPDGESEEESAEEKPDREHED